MTLAVAGVDLHAMEMQRTSVLAGGIGNCIGSQNVFGYRIKGKALLQLQFNHQSRYYKWSNSLLLCCLSFRNRRHSQNPFN